MPGEVPFPVEPLQAVVDLSRVCICLDLECPACDPDALYNCSTWPLSATLPRALPALASRHRGEPPPRFVRTENCRFRMCGHIYL